MEISHTRAMVSAVLDGTLRDVTTEADPIFNLQIPTACPGVPEELLNPRNTWTDKDAYDAKALDLANRFKENFRTFADDMADEVAAAGPR